MSQDLALSSTVINLADNFDDLLESLSTLQQLGDQQQLMRDALHILYHSYKATSCTIYVWPSEQAKRTAATAPQSLIAIDSNGILHHCYSTTISHCN
ncbi:MAG: hypothetical protein B6I37_02545 [Desulfobacteraceae bacterium 4572_35.2]|nr:MAG: hypothetical protein B6I37_02545 [Desulfobacteraceae bacterium 4572_35.2]